MLEVSCNEETPSAKNAPSNKGKKIFIVVFHFKSKIEIFSHCQAVYYNRFESRKIIFVSRSKSLSEGFFSQF